MGPHHPLLPRGRRLIPISLILPEELLLLALDDESGKFVVPWIDYACAGGVLAELILRGRIRIDDRERVVVADSGPTGDTVLDEALARTAERKPRLAMHWLSVRTSPRKQLLDRLVDNGILRTEEGRVLWIFPRTLYPAGDPVPELNVRDRIRQALEGGAPDARAAVLLGLLHGAHGLLAVLSKEEARRYRARVEQIYTADPVAFSVQRAVSRAVTAAQAAAASAATT